MKLLFWISGVLVVLLAVPSLFFFALHLSTGEPIPLARAIQSHYEERGIRILGRDRLKSIERADGESRPSVVFLRGHARSLRRGTPRR